MEIVNLFYGHPTQSGGSFTLFRPLQSKGGKIMKCVKFWSATDPTILHPDAEVSVVFFDLAKQ